MILELFATIVIYSKKPVQYDISRDRTKPGKLMKVRLLNARLAKYLISPDAETDILHSLKFEKRGKYLNMVLTPKNKLKFYPLPRGRGNEALRAAGRGMPRPYL